MTGTARVRIGRVTLHGGASLRIMAPPIDEGRARVEAAIRTVLDAHCGGFAGFAIVVWCPDGSSTAQLGYGGGIPSILVPDFVRARLLGGVIEGWAIDTVNASWGHPPA